MDPQSKRTFWNCISSSFKNQSKTAVLTTHSMEEVNLNKIIALVIKKII